MSPTWAIIGSDNGLSPDRHQAILWTIIWIIVNWSLRNKIQSNFIQNANIFIKENAFENVICKTTAILSQPECFKYFIMESVTP